MDFKEKLSFEDTNRRNIYFHLEGSFFVMYNQSAFLFLRDVQSMTRDGKPIKVGYRIIKKLNRECFKIGIPSVCLRDFVKGRKVYDVPGFNSRLCHIVLDRDIDDGAYATWCEGRRLRSIHMQDPSRMEKLLTRQPFRATARDVFKSVLDIYGNCNRRLDRLGGDVYDLSKAIYLGSVKFFKSENRTAEANRLYTACWDLESLIYMMTMKGQVSDSTACDLGDELDSLRRQFTGLGRAAAAKAAAKLAGKEEKEEAEARGVESFLTLEEVEPAEEVPQEAAASVSL